MSVIVTNKTKIWIKSKQTINMLLNISEGEKLSALKLKPSYVQVTYAFNDNFWNIKFNHNSMDSIFPFLVLFNVIESYFVH
jgi:hypothetical protein